MNVPEAIILPESNALHNGKVAPLIVETVVSWISICVAPALVVYVETNLNAVPPVVPGGVVIVNVVHCPFSAHS